MHLGMAEFRIPFLGHFDLDRVSKIIISAGCPLVREIWFFFKVGEFCKMSGKLENVQKLGNFKIMFCSTPSKTEQVELRLVIMINDCLFRMVNNAI